MTSRIPAARVAGGEGGEAWELHQVRAHLWVGLGGRGDGRSWVVDGEQRRSAPGIWQRGCSGGE